jgi:hypothetical protein
MTVRRVKKLTIDEAKKLRDSKEYNFRYLIGWTAFDAFADYYVDAERKLCLRIHFNKRAGTDNSALYQFDDFAELANWIWSEEGGTIPFREIADRIREVFGVDVAMSPRNKLVSMLFGEAGRTW